MSLQFVKPYVKTNKNDQADAEAICEAVTKLTEILDEGNLSQLGYQTFSELKEEFLDNDKKITEIEKRLKVIARFC
jgi:hypothetical protein